MVGSENLRYCHITPEIISKFEDSEVRLMCYESDKMVLSSCGPCCCGCALVGPVTLTENRKKTEEARRSSLCGIRFHPFGKASPYF